MEAEFAHQEHKEHNLQLHMQCAANSARTPAPRLTAQGKNGSPTHLVHAAKADALDGAPLARRQRRREAQAISRLEHSQGDRHHRSIGAQAVAVGLDLHACGWAGDKSRAQG